MAQPSQVDILAALQAQQSSRSRAPPSTSLLSDHPDPKAALTTPEGEGESSKLWNKGKIYCFREGCGCVILSPGIGQWVQAESNLIPTEEGSPFPQSAAREGQSVYWYITGSPMSFDNIGFSKPSDLKALPPHAPGNAPEKKVKWLSCADCDLGPVGWSFEGGTEAWLAVERVRYTKP